MATKEELAFQDFLSITRNMSDRQVAQWYENSGAARRGMPLHEGWFYGLNEGGGHYLDTVLPPKTPWTQSAYGFEPDAIKHVGIKPTPPTIMSPTLGQEVSNLDPFIRIRHGEAVDQLRTETFFNTGGGIGRLGQTDQIGPVIGPEGIYTYFVTDTTPLASGRPVKIRIPVTPIGSYNSDGGYVENPNPLGEQDVKYEIYKFQLARNASIGQDWYNPKWKDDPDLRNIMTWTKLMEGYVPTGRNIIDVPYDKMFRNGVHYTVVFVKPVSRTDIAIVTTKRGFINDYVPEQKWYFYNHEGNWQTNGWTMVDTTRSTSIPSIGMATTSGHQKDMTYHYELSLDNGSSWITIGTLEKTGGRGYVLGGGLVDPVEKRTLRTGIVGEVNQSSFTIETDENYSEIYNVNIDISNLIEAGKETYQARLRIRGEDDNGSYSESTWWGRYNNFSDWATMDGVFTIIRHIPPGHPTNLRISETGIIDRTIDNRLSWKYNQNSMNNRQGSALVQWRKQGTTPWNEIQINNMNTFYDVPANTFPLGKIEWRVKTWNYVDMEGPFSDIVLFEAKDTPLAPIIYSPIETVEVTSPMVVWEHDYIQTHYQIQVLNTGDLILWDTGTVAGVQQSRKADIYLDNLTSFKAKVRVRNNEGLWSNWATSIFNTDYKYPAPARVTATARDGYISIAYENGVPTGNQPFTDRNEVYKSYDKKDWVKISDSYVFSFDDYSAPNDVEVSYFIRSYAPNGAYTDSEIVTATVKVTGVVMYLVNDPQGTLHRFKMDGHGRSEKRSIESTMMRFKGRKHPVVEVGMMEDNVIDFTLLLDEDDKQALDNIIYSGQICCYRDGRGRVGYGIFTEYPVTDERWGGYTVNLSLTKIDYVEQV